MAINERKINEMYESINPSIKENKGLAEVLEFFKL